MSTTRVPLREGYFTEDGGGHLLASKCKVCGQVFFPPLYRCKKCYSQEIESIKLSRTGAIYTYTISRMPAAKYEPPFALGWVEFPEGVRVFGQLKDWEKVDLKIGMPVKVVIDTLWTEETEEVYGYKFAPVT